MGVLHYSFGYSFLAINFQTKRNQGFSLIHRYNIHSWYSN